MVLSLVHPILSLVVSLNGYVDDLGWPVGTTILGQLLMGYLKSCDVTWCCFNGARGGASRELASDRTARWGVSFMHMIYAGLGWFGSVDF